MKKFSFSLERVLNYKEQVEQNVRNEHAQAVRKVRDKDQQIEELEHQFDSDKCGLEEMKAGTVSAARMLEYSSYLEVLIHSKTAEKGNLKKLKIEEEEKRSRVIEAKKEASSIQMLKDKKKREYDAEVAKAEEKEIEEFVSNRSLAAKN